MAKLSIGQVYDLLRQAGFSQAAAAEMTAIAIAESGLNPTIQGDIGLENSTYGPSVGLFQIRTVKSQTGSGQDRDESALLASPQRQAKAAYAISDGGTNFRPWSTWLHGTAQAQLPSVLKALGAKSLGDLPGTADAPPVTGGGSSAAGATASNAGLISTPLGWLGKVLGLPSGSDVAGDVGKVAVFTVLIAGGAGLVVLGAWRSVQPAVQPKIDDLKQEATTAAQAGAMIA